MARSGQSKAAAPAGAEKPRATAASAKAAAAKPAGSEPSGAKAPRAAKVTDLAAVAEERKGTDCQIINSLARGLKILSAFGHGDTVLTNKDFALRAGLPKPTVSRLTNTLARLNFLARDAETGGYRLGEATLALGLSASASIDLPHVAGPFMRAFANEHDVGVSLAVRDRLEMRALAYVVSDLYNSARGATGAHLALYARQAVGASASGYALLAAMSLPERAALFEQLEEQAGSSAWPNTRRRIEFAIEDIDRYGFCASMREWDRTLNSAATPIAFSAKGIPMSLACVAPSSELPESRIRNKIGPALVELKHRIDEAFREQTRG